MKVAAVIPSRYGSTRLAGKPLALIAGIPMIQRVYERVTQTSDITDVVVATDSQRIINAVQGFGGRALMTSGQCRTGSDRVALAAEALGLWPEDIVVNIQGDQPLIHPETITATVRPLLASTDIAMTTAAFAITDKREIADPKDVKVVFDVSGRALYFSRSPIPLARDAAAGPDASFDTYKHLGIYAYTKRFLDAFTRWPTGRLEEIEKLEQLRVLEHGHDIVVIVSPHDSPEVDLPEDVDRIETLLARQRN